MKKKKNESDKDIEIRTQLIHKIKDADESNDNKRFRDKINAILEGKLIKVNTVDTKVSESYFTN